MADAPAAANANPEITGSAPFYVRPEPLNIEQHGKLGLVRTDTPFKFASKQNFVPLLAPEFPMAATTFPIVFAGDERAPLAIMGLSQGENLFYGADGSHRPDTYLPAYVRRYPFTIANDTANNRFVVCIDRGSELLAENTETPIFENGQLSEYGKNSVAFCESFETDRQNSDFFMGKMKEFDLFETREATFTPTNPDGTAGQPQVIAGFFAISEEKLRALPDEKFNLLKNMGALTLIYAHLISLNHWDRLISMTMTKREEEARKAAAN